MTMRQICQGQNEPFFVCGRQGRGIEEAFGGGGHKNLLIAPCLCALSHHQQITMVFFTAPNCH